jgi:N-acyl-phosphatidylethanolamine-hydrolysing phospholipase D
MSRRGKELLTLACLALGVTACDRVSMLGRFLGGNLDALFRKPRTVERKITDVRTDARLAVLWVGHATVLVQMHDKFILTDPVFTSTVGQVSRRLVEPGLDAANLPPLDAVVISHMHFDHLSLGTLDLIEEKARVIVLPEGGTIYVPGARTATVEVPTFESWEHDGLRITAVPVRHNGWRYGMDAPWMETSYTGYVLEYRGQIVYFGGDTAYDETAFVRTRKRFPKIDLAVLPIAPVEPRDFMCRFHVDPHEALAAYRHLGARWMVPMHFDTFVNSLDEVGDAPRALRERMKADGLTGDDVAILEIGEQRVFRR